MNGSGQVFGHEDVRRDLARAVARDELPGSLLLHGPDGVGRQTLALWLARLMVCERPGPDGPCGDCRSCRLALDLQHPDIHWFFPLPRPKGASGPEKLAEALEDARFAELAERRADPLHRPPPDEPAGLYLAQIRTLRKRGATRPAMARRQVFIVGNAELLVPQEASEEAANALLKLLEEPPPATTLILTAADPEGLLPTLRSRLLPVRLRPFSDQRVAEFLHQRAGADPETALRAARLAQGSPGRALSFLPQDGAPAPTEQRRTAALDWLEAALELRPDRRYAAAHAERPAGARGPFSDTLAFLTVWLRDLAAVAAGAERHLVDADSLDRLRTLAGRIRAENVPVAIQEVEAARDEGRINANPQLTLAGLLTEIGTILRR